jgi:two-component system, cell cycle sensor histidine kinase and response regulator CckA
VKDAERAARRATDVTQQLLTFAKGGDPVRTTVDLTEIVREAATFARHGSNVRVDFFFAADLPPAEVDAGQVSRVVHNLVLNAVQCLQGGGEVRVGLSAREIKDREVMSLPAGRYLLMTVADNGPGIPADRLPRIFDPYYTTKVRGSGLGLATCHSIVKKHQGHIEVASSPQTGTIFHIWLPAAKNTHTHIRIDTSSPLAPDGARILFMDDDEGVLKLARAYLERAGHDGVLVSDGKDAVAVYRQALAAGNQFDVVIFDLTVPGGMGGKEALEQLKAIDPGVRAIASSGYSNDPIMANHHAFGFRAVLPKPYDLDSFIRVIARVRAGKA